MTLVLAGDVGGTKTRLGLYRFAAGGPGPTRLSLRTAASFASAAYPGLAPVVAEFLAAADLPFSDRPAVACFGVAGPVVDDAVETTNLPWRIEAQALATATGISRVVLLNDLVATAEGIPALPPEALVPLTGPSGPASPTSGGNAALVAAGTGLGMAILARLPDGGFLPVASEGGHMTYGPRTADEFALARHLRALYGHVSWERVASGLALPDLYDFARASSPELPAIVRRRAEGGDLAAAVSEAALAGDPAASRALDLFVAGLGAAAGNLALVATATAGLYLGGGIPPKILPLLKAGFLPAFLDKGRFRGYLERIPVHVVLEPDAALLGAARVAARAAENDRGSSRLPGGR